MGNSAIQKDSGLVSIYEALIKTFLLNTVAQRQVKTFFKDRRIATEELERLLSIKELGVEVARQAYPTPKLVEMVLESKDQDLILALLKNPRGKGMLSSQQVTTLWKTSIFRRPLMAYQALNTEQLQSLQGKVSITGVATLLRNPKLSGIEREEFINVYLDDLLVKNNNRDSWEVILLLKNYPLSKENYQRLIKLVIKKGRDPKFPEREPWLTTRQIQFFLEYEYLAPVEFYKAISLGNFTGNYGVAIDTKKVKPVHYAALYLTTRWKTVRKMMENSLLKIVETEGLPSQLKFLALNNKRDMLKNNLTAVAQAYVKGKAPLEFDEWKKDTAIITTANENSQIS